MTLYRMVVLLYGTMLLLFTGCEDPVVTPNDKIVKGDDQTIVTTDTLTLRTSTVKEKPLPTTNLDNAVLGRIEDAVYGQSTASFYTEVTLPANDVNFDDNLAFDSLILTLDYSGDYGDIDEPQDIVVYQLSQKIQDDEEYNSDAAFQTNSNILGRLDDFSPDLTDSTIIDGETVPGHMRIRLDQDKFVGKTFIKRVENGFVDKEDFTNYLQGFYVAVDTAQGTGKSVVYFDLASSQSKLTLYYKDGNNNPKTFDFVIDETDWVNHYAHDYSGSSAASLLSGGQKSDSLTMIQGLLGLKTKIEVPYLKNLDNILVNKAELTLTVADDPTPDSDEFPAPVALRPQRVGTNNENLNIQDNFDPDYLGGNIFSGTNSLGNNVNRYKFNLARYFQRAINGKVKNRGIFLITRDFNAIADRVILNGANNSANGAKLKLTYTKIE